MTRDEAIKILLKRQGYCKVIAEYANNALKVDKLQEIEAINLALSALRPACRERVEKVWKGCINCRDEEKLAKHIHCWPSFCPACGRPLTDEAAQMVMERINKMEETGNELG